MKNSQIKHHVYDKAREKEEGRTGARYLADGVEEVVDWPEVEFKGDCSVKESKEKEGTRFLLAMG